jgi:hypothetical protein
MIRTVALVAVVAVAGLAVVLLRANGSDDADQLVIAERPEQITGLTVTLGADPGKVVDPARLPELLTGVLPLPATRVLPVEDLAQVQGPPAGTADFGVGDRTVSLRWWGKTFDGIAHYARSDRHSGPVLVDTASIDRLSRLAAPTAVGASQ